MVHYFLQLKLSRSMKMLSNLKMIHFMVRDDTPHPLVIALKANGNMENGKVRVRLCLPLATAIRANGKMI